MNKKRNPNKIILNVPEIVRYLGIINSVIFSIFAIVFILTSEEQLHWSFYIFYGAFISVGVFMVVLTKRWKVVVKNDKITVYTLINGQYSFTCDEIVSIQRQTKKNRVKSERIVIKTSGKKKLIVESSHTSYFKFVSYLIDNTEISIRSGFEDYSG